MKNPKNRKTIPMTKADKFLCFATGYDELAVTVHLIQTRLFPRAESFAIFPCSNTMDL